ncbi:sensor histidine kinase [Curtobacterium sp. MCPF17_031]|uniref:sensor histidine kinase n=1 Tax=Curtobacterium sp. MCPF17_031 TaxID=2175653 RepID=UPI000DA796DF|nr:histidine kinase [Curtobacterium sp. MCPF17_031]PZE37020.1 hypothetical protein DEJ31_07755 [Curtobacterium sp. MCPF17_031]
MGNGPAERCGSGQRSRRWRDGGRPSGEQGSGRIRRHGADALVALGFAVVLVVYSILETGFAYQGPENVIPVAAVLLVLVRRLIPWLGLAGQLGVDLVDRWAAISSEPFGAAVALFTIATMRNTRTLVVANGVALVVLVASVAVAGRTVRGAVVCLAVYALGSVSGWAVRRSSLQRLHVLRLGVLARQHREALARAEERATIAAAAHDTVTAALAVVLRLGEAARAQVDHDPRTASLTLERLTTVARSGMGEVRRFVRIVDPDPDRDPDPERDPDREPCAEGSAATSLDQVIADVRAAGVPISSSVRGAPADGRTAEVVTRVVQESLTNVLKHADPTAVQVLVRYPEDGTPGSVLVRNDGVRPGPRGNGRGLRGLERRLQAVGGRCVAGPAEQDGTWEVTAVLPGGAGLPSVAVPDRTDRTGAGNRP